MCLDIIKKSWYEDNDLIDCGWKRFLVVNGKLTALYYGNKVFPIDEWVNEKDYRPSLVDKMDIIEDWEGSHHYRKGFHYKRCIIRPNLYNFHKAGGIKLFWVEVRNMCAVGKEITGTIGVAKEMKIHGKAPNIWERWKMKRKKGKERIK